MKIAYLLMSLGLAATAFCVWAIEPSFASDGWWSRMPPDRHAFPLLCRGPLDIAVRPGRRRGAQPNEFEVAIPFVRNNRGAGASGRQLSAGTCGWVDRPVAPGEPGVLFFTVSPGSNGIQGPMYRTMLMCTSKPGCVFAINATSQPSAEGDVLIGLAMVRTYLPLLVEPARPPTTRP